MKDLTKGSVGGHILQLSLFIAMSTTVQTLYFLADLYFVGRLGKEAIAGVALGGNLMMLVLALSSDVPTVYERALRTFTVDEIAEAFAATRGITMPSQLRRMMRSRGRDLHAEFRALLPYRLAPVAIQRFSTRRVVLTLAVGVVTLLLALAASPLLLTSPLP